MNVSTKQQRIAELAKRSPQVSFTSLNHYLDLDWLEAAYRRLRKDSAPGYDAQTVQDYGKELEANLPSLLGRAKSGSYFAPPVRRVYVPKGTGKESRPIGVPSTEDKLLQRAVAMLLEPIYEQDFLDCSYGFRPGRSAHDALDALWRQSMEARVQWILDVDISKFFDTLDQAQLRTFLHHETSWQMAERGCAGARNRTLSGAGYAPRGQHFTAAQQRLPPLCARPMVCHRGEAAHEGSCLHDSLR